MSLTRMGVWTTWPLPDSLVTLPRCGSVPSGSASLEGFAPPNHVCQINMRRYLTVSASSPLC